MDNARTNGPWKRMLLALVGLAVAPILGVWAGGSMPNPPGNGPGIGQIVVGVAVPVLLTAGAGAAARTGRLEAAVWVITSLALTGGLVVFLAWFVHTYMPT